jgi:type I restriction enzyme R subunit
MTWLYLVDRYVTEGITKNEIEGIILSLLTVSGSVYEANKTVFKLIVDGFILNRNDRTHNDFFVELIDFAAPENNIFKIVNLG